MCYEILGDAKEQEKAREASQVQELKGVKEEGGKWPGLI